MAIADGRFSFQLQESLLMQLTRKQVRTIRQMLRRAFGLTARSRSPAIAMIASSSSLLVQAATESIALEYHQPGNFESEQLGVPYQALLDSEGTRSEPVTFQNIDGQLQVEWTTEEIPHTLRYPLEQIESFPPMPLDLYHNDGQLLTALHDAVETAEKEATRYALDHLRLRGSDGQIAATDGRQALVQTGFTFPWEDAVLIPATPLFTAKELHKFDLVKVGRTEDWITLQIGPWSIHLKINHEARFPNLDDCIPDPSQAVTKLHLAPSDAEFLTRTLKQLPAADQYDRPITIDLNGAAVVRARSEDQPLTEVRLTNSHRTGEELRVACNRDYLARAAKLGFREIQFAGQDSPVTCRDDNRRYVWALFAKGSALTSNDPAVQITSPPGPAPAPATASRPRNGAKPRRPRTGSQKVYSEAARLTGLVADLRDRLSVLASQAEDLIGQLEQFQSGAPGQTNRSPDQLQGVNA